MKNKKRKRAKNIHGTASVPRIAVFKSLKNIYAQAIDDDNGVTLAAASSKDKSLERKANDVINIEVASKVGELIATRMQAKKIERVVFDRRNYRYHGRVKALADGIRAGGVKV